MKKLKLLILCTLVSLTATAQQTVKISYDAVSRNIRNDSLKTEKMLLVADTGKSLYFNKMSMYVDSLTSTPEGQKQLRSIQMAAWVTQNADGSITVNKNRGNAPDKSIHTYIAKDRNSGDMTVYDKWGDGIYYYNEPLDEMQWEVQADTTATILGYECFMAVSDYHGRRWTAWFTPEVPVPDGPWKLHCPGGMILKADTGDGFSFEATAIELTDSPVPDVYSKDKYSKSTRKKLLADHDYYQNNLASILSGQGITLGNPNSLPEFVRARHAIETDY